jgi:hypothetical protein
MTVDAPPAVPKAAFVATVAVLNSVETDAGKAALLAGLLGYFLSSLPWELEAKFAETITRLGLEAAAAARNGEAAGNDG